MSVYVPWDMKDIQWPCSAWWHLPLEMEISWLINLWISIGAWSATGAVDFATKLHIPFAWNRDSDTSNAAYQWTRGLYWGCWAWGTDLKRGNWFWMISSSWTLDLSNGYRSEWRTIRPFKNTYAKPTESWTVIEWTLWSAWIFWDTVWWMITITDGSMGYTIADKNLWATTVWNSWDTLSVANCWKYYQRWNNYWFAFSVSVTKSSSRVDASTYWPWNYYSSSTFLWVWYPDWSSVQNNNLWGGDTWVRPVEITNAYIGIPNPESITLNKSSISLTTIGQTEQLTATIEPTISDHSVTWSSDDTTIATVSTTGLVTCVNPWNCVITAITANGLTASCGVKAWLPNTYQEVEWIGCDSAWPYIDTGVLPKDSTLSQIKFMNLATTGYVIYWMYNWDDNTSYRLFNYQNRIYFDLANRRTYGSTLSSNNLYEFEIWNNYVKNVWASSNLITWTTVGSYTWNTNIMLNWNNSGNISRNRWYYVKIWEWATQVRDFVPCYRIADSVIWMYDLVNWVFYTNAGSGTFTKWSDV